MYLDPFSLQTNSSLRASPRLSPRLSPRISPRPGPCLSPCLRRSLSSGSRSNSWKRRRSQEGDRRCLVPECKIDSLDTDDDDVFQPNCPTPTPHRSVHSDTNIHADGEKLKPSSLALEICTLIFLCNTNEHKHEPLSITVAFCCINVLGYFFSASHSLCKHESL